MRDPRSFRRISHRLPANLYVTNKAGQSKEYAAELKDLSVAALCLVLPGSADAILRQGARTRITFQTPASNGQQEITGSVLYTLIAEDGSRQCVILFDAIYENLVSLLPGQESVQEYV